MAYKSTYKPKNPEKYNGNLNNIVCRSLWERKVCQWLDDNENVEKWSSEEVQIPYYINGSYHRYFPDFLVKFKNGKCIMIEVKPHYQTKQPKEKKNKRKYLNEMKTYLVNTTKWEYARSFCKKHNIEFQIWTENQLKSLGLKIT